MGSLRMAYEVLARKYEGKTFVVSFCVCSWEDNSKHVGGLAQFGRVKRNAWKSLAFECLRSSEILRSV